MYLMNIMNVTIEKQVTKSVMTGGCCIGLLILSSCGFALRGTQSPLPERFEKTHVKDLLTVNDSFQRRVKQLIAINGGQIVARQLANVVLSIGEIKERSRQIALSSDAATKEVERVFSVTVTVVDRKSGVHLGSRTLSTTRNVQIDARRVLASEEQSAVIREASERTLAQAVINYLKSF